MQKVNLGYRKQIMFFLKKIIILSFIALQIVPYLHLQEHGHGCEHEKEEENCQIVFFINSHIANDDFGNNHIAEKLPSDNFGIVREESQIILVELSHFSTRAPPQPV